MLESIRFHFKCIGSDEMEVLNCKMDSGLFEEHFLPRRTINTVSIRGRDVEYFQSIKYDPISFPITFYIENELTLDQAQRLNQWLYSEYYEPFYFDEYPERIYYVMYQGDSRLFHNGMQGYVTIEFVSNSPYSYSTVWTDNVDSSNYNGISPTTFDLYNIGDVALKPEIFIKMKANGDVTIRNVTNSIDFKFTGLLQNETVFVDCENQEIESDLPNTYRYSNFNGKYLKLESGVNQLEIHGKCEIEFKYRYKYLR